MTIPTSAQMLTQKELGENMIPDFNWEFMGRNKIQKLELTSFKLLSTGGELPLDIREWYTFNEKGKIDSYGKIERGDTTEEHTYAYTERGMLKWVIVEDKKWSRKYKSGFRFNQDKTIFQVKSYESITEEEVMLLDTKEYFYSDSKQSMIKVIVSDKVTKVHKFQYDDKDRLVAEKLEQPAGSIVQDTRYVYDNANNITNIVQKGNKNENRVFSYDKKGNILQIDWKEGPNQSIAYEYDERGDLIRYMDHTSKFANVRKKRVKFDYEFYQTFQASTARTSK